MVKVVLKPRQGIKVGSSNKYLFDPAASQAYDDIAKDWATKTDGLVDEEDYSSKAYAIGGQGTETNNSKYYAEQAAISEANAMASEISAEGSAETATTQAGIATEKAEEASTSATNAGISETNAYNYEELSKGYSESASDSATTATEKAAEADTSATNASGFASNAEQSADEAEEWAEKAKEWAKTIDPSAYEKHIITTTGDSGLLTQEQIDIISDNQKNYLFINDGEVYQLVNTDSSITYKTFINFDIALSESITSKAIYIQLSPQAGNYGRWSKEDIDFEGYTAGSGLTLTGKQFSANVINSVTSSSTTDSLSANMGKELQDQITHLSTIGRFLALWDCKTGLPLTEPEVMPYEYRTGDYFIVSNTGTTNYKPTGSSYAGVASTVVETGTVNEKNTYFYDGTSWSLIAGSGSIEVDNLTCEFTAQNKLQVIGVIDQNDSTTALKTWTGTKAQYDAITTKDDNTLYNITDDQPQIITDFVTLVNAVASQLNNKVDLADGANQGNVDYVVETQLPTAENNYTWYRVYKSGWVEQGGKASSSSVTLLKEMKDTNYSISMTQISLSAYAAQPQSPTTNSFTYYNYQNSYNAYWEVKGMGAN